MSVRRRIAVLSACALLCSALLYADALSVDFDPHADFSVFKTFALRETTVDSPRPELDNSLFVKKLATTVRAALGAKGLTETTTRPDLLIDVRLTGEDFSMSQRGTPMPAGPGRRTVSSGPRPLRFTEGTLVIDMTKPGEATPVWRGVYRDDERTGSKLVEKLPTDAKKLLARYPPKKNAP